MELQNSLAWNIHRMHSGMKQGKLCAATDLVSNVVLLPCQTQFINYEYCVPTCMLENFFGYRYLGFISTTTCQFFLSKVQVN